MAIQKLFLILITFLLSISYLILHQPGQITNNFKLVGGDARSGPVPFRRREWAGVTGLAVSIAGKSKG